jgi:hypothetical protein
MQARLDDVVFALAAAMVISGCATEPGFREEPSVSSGTGGVLQPGFAGAGTGTSVATDAGTDTGTGGVSSAAGNGSTPAAAGGGGGSAAGRAGGGAGGTVGSAGGAAPGGGGGAYVTAGAWHGYAWTSAVGMGSTISPTTFDAVAVGDPLCVSGSVAGFADFSGVALLGVNLNQEKLGNAAALSIMPTKNGLLVSVKNTGGSPLRVQVQGANGGTDPNERWCAPLADSGGFIPWASFNTKCWDGSGMAYTKQAIVAAMILVPGGETAPVTYDFCLNSLSEADSATGGGAGSGGAPGGGGAGGTRAGAGGTGGGAAGRAASGGRGGGGGSP